MSILFIYLFQIKAKIESDRVIGSVGKKVAQETGIKVRSRSHNLSMAHRNDFQHLLQGITGEIPHRPLDLNMKEYAGFQIALLNKVSTTVCNVVIFNILPLKCWILFHMWY